MPERSRALITGASSGIGAAMALELALRGSDLVLVARRRAVLEAMAADLVAEHDVEVEILPADLTDPEQLASVEHRITSEEAAVDLLVNNAGVGTAGDFAALPVEAELEMLTLNIDALVRLTHAALRVMLPRRRGGIINVGSLGAYQPSPGYATYSATKAFVHSFSQAVHEEVRGSGVTVTVLNPGFTHTEFQDHAGMAKSALPDFLWQEADIVARAGLDANARGRAVAIPGPLNTATAAFSVVLPGVVSRKLAAGVARREQAGRDPA